jgi:hypothetical protein
MHGSNEGREYFNPGAHNLNPLERQSNHGAGKNKIGRTTPALELGGSYGFSAHSLLPIHQRWGLFCPLGMNRAFL